jgi:hypothetical protein
MLRRWSLFVLELRAVIQTNLFSVSLLYAQSYRCWTEAEFYDEIQTKVLRVFLLAIHSHPSIAWPWDSNFFKLTQPLTVSTIQLLYTVKEKGGKPDRKPYPLPFGLRNPYRNLKFENSQDNARKPQRNCNFMNSASVYHAKCITFSLMKVTRKRVIIFSQGILEVTWRHCITSEYCGHRGLPNKCYIFPMPRLIDCLMFILWHAHEKTTESQYRIL